MRKLTIRLRLAWAVLTGRALDPEHTLATCVMRQRDAAWRNVDGLVRDVLLAPDLTAAKIVAATALRDLEIGGTGATWALANAALGVSPTSPERRPKKS